MSHRRRGSAKHRFRVAANDLLDFLLKAVIEQRRAVVKLAQEDLRSG